MKSLVSKQPPVTFQANREHDNSHFGWILPRTCHSRRTSSSISSSHVAILLHKDISHENENHEDLSFISHF